MEANIQGCSEISGVIMRKKDIKTFFIRELQNCQTDTERATVVALGKTGGIFIGSRAILLLKKKNKKAPALHRGHTNTIG